MKYYLWVGVVRFELKRPLTWGERFQVWMTPNYSYEVVRA